MCAVTIVSRIRGTKLPNSVLGMIFIAVNWTDWQTDNGGKRR